MTNVFITEDMGREHVIEEDYITNVLDNGTSDDTCDDWPNVIRFNEEDDLSKDFTFKVEMEFSSLKQFKDAIL